MSQPLAQLVVPTQAVVRHLLDLLHRLCLHLGEILILHLQVLLKDLEESVHEHLACSITVLSTFQRVLVELY